MSEGREKLITATVQSYLSTGKLADPGVGLHKLGILEAIYEITVSVFLILVYIIRYNLSRIIPALSGPKYDVRNKVVLLTGAGGGFGRRLAEQLTARGAIVACVDVDKDANQRCVSAANSAAVGRKDSETAAYAFQANLADREESKKVVKEVEEKLGRIDILITAAVCFVNHPIGDFEDDEIDFLIDLNLKSTIWLTRAVIPGMKKRNSGHIAVFSSAAALAPSPGISLYCACKSALTGLMNSLYFEFQQENYDIGVTAIHPFFSPTSPLIRECTRNRLPDVDPDKAATDIIDAIEARQLNLYLPRYLALACLMYGFLPKEAISQVLKVVDLRVALPGIMPKATITVDKWNEVYGVFRGPSGGFITAHDDDNITQEMIGKTSEMIETLKEKLDQGGNIVESVNECVRSLESKYVNTGTPETKDSAPH